MTHFHSCKKWSCIKYKFASVDKTLYECFVCDKKKSSCEGDSPATAQNEGITLGRGALDKNSPDNCYDCVCKHVTASLRIPYCAGRCLENTRHLTF